MEPTLVPEVFLEIFFGKERASPRVRSWHCRLHESEIRGQGNQRVLSLIAASRLALSSRRKISRKTSGTRVSETLSRKVSPPLTSFPSFLNVSFSLYPHESASTWCHWEGSVFTTISLTPRTVFTWIYGFDTCTMKCSDFRLETTNNRSSLIDACNVLKKRAIYQLWLDD